MSKFSLAVMCAGALIATMGTSASDAGDYSIDWSAFDWPDGETGPLVRTLRDQYGFEVDATVEHSGDFISYRNSSGVITPTPDDTTIFGGNIESLILVSDAPPNQGAIGDARIISSVSASSGGVAIRVDNLTIDVLDIDANDNNSTADRCDFITAFGDNGNPTLSPVSATPTLVTGPGTGSGLTGALTANQAQCIYNDGPAGSPTSPNDDTGTVRASFPDATSSVTFWYDESIQNVRNYNVFTNYDPGARGIGMFGNANFTVDQSISLDRSATPTSALAGDNVTYTYTVTNNGALPFNPNQDVIIEDSLLGTVTCPAIAAPIAPGGTVVCSASYTLTPADLITGSVDSTATAGIGAIGQAFPVRLQSNPQSLSVASAVNGPISGPQSCSPVSIFDSPRTQLAGSGSAGALTLSDVFLFDDVTTDVNGNPIDVVFQIDQISDATAVNVSTGLEARMTPADDAFVSFHLRLVQDGTATTANPQGTAIDQSRINGILVQQTDVDSRGTSDDSSDVVGTLDPVTNIYHFNTAPLASFPVGNPAIAMDPAKTGDPTNWLDEPNETNFDNYVTMEFDTFVEARFIHGYTGTSTNDATRGTTILLCAISNTSPDVIAEDDDYTASPINALAGGTAGEVMANDTINGLPAAFPTATLEVLVEATPQNTGDPVPTLEVSGAAAGSVLVPAGVPAGVYTIEYQLCDAVDPTDCDRAKVTVAVFDGNGLDFGDAPVSYLTASHGISLTPTIYLGDTPPDSEIVPQSDATATADDLLETDDEDAVIFPILTQGVNVTLDIDVTGLGYLQAWIDFNGDGVFEDALSERIATDLRDNGTGADVVAGDGVIQVNVTVPTDATTSTTFARFRYGSENGLSMVSFAVDGEVEDYSLLIAAADLVDRGDAPASYGDPRHAVVPSIYLGAGLPDTEVTPQNSPLADADDLAGDDDEDSIAGFPLLVAGSTVPLTVQTNETLSIQLALGIPVSEGITNLQLWIDFDQSGTFEPTEQIAVDYRDGGFGDTDGTFNNQISLNIAVPSDIGNGTSFARLRWSTSSAVAADPFDGFNADGEVEDYLVTLSNPNGPLVCDTGFFMVYASNGKPILEKLQITGSPGSYTSQRTTYPPDFAGNYGITGWGWSEVDNYIYGILRNTFQLHRVTYSGAVQPVIDMAGLGLGTVGSTLEILPNGIMIYNILGQSGRYQLLDISDPLSPVNLGVLDAGGGAPNGLDMSYNIRDGLIYMISNGNSIYAMDPKGGTSGATTTTLVAANVPLPAGFGSSQLDSVWMDENGFLYAYDNNSRQVFGLEVGAAGARPASYQFFAIDGTGSAPIGNDGASCRKGSLYATSVFAEGTISGTLFEDTDNSGTLNGGETGLSALITVALYNDNGTPTDIADDVLVQTGETLNDGTYSFAAVDATLTYRIEVDETDPDIPAALSLSTTNPLTGVTVTTGADTSGQDFGFATVAAAADLSLSKLAQDTSGVPLTQADAGTAFDFVLTVTNDGPGAASDVTVIDRLPDGYSYVSDDAAATGGSYDEGTGLWTLGNIANGATASLTIRVTMNATGEHTNVAEITGSSLPDPDSDPAVGPLTDDLSDEIADDDEAQATVTLTGAGAVISGTVFIDNGNGGGTSFDGAQNGTEIGSPAATVSVFDSTNTLIDTPEVAADGAWSLVLPAGYSDVVTVVVTPDAAHLVISETPTAFPSQTNTDTRDGRLSFTAAANTDYAGLDVGLLQSAKLNESQDAAIAAGQVALLRHEYYADADGTVIFDTTVVSQAPAGAFTVALFEDNGCDGTADVVISGPLTIAPDTLICVIARVSASSAVGPNSSYIFDLTADTTYGTTGITEQDRNTDRLTADAQQGSLKLSKTVRNVTQNSVEAVANGGTLGDVLEYKIYLENPTSLPATDVTIYDKTPPYTVLDGPIPSPITVGGSLTCTVGLPVANVAGYAGNLRWDCTGTYLPGSQGAVSFEVKISP
ncbi:DUF11 domain-containing protein [Pacificibacter marinus]|uniref:DUF11 domain-containing protein n=1 Tax=Pacificibacter marinus TaxID=658057 RepID=UPI001FCCDB7D|nr:DUF11 domain-containing protein [Pacificibacter marinus]